MYVENDPWVISLRNYTGSCHSAWQAPTSLDLKIDDSHCERIHSPLTAVCCFDDGYVVMHPVARKEYCAEYCLTLSQRTLLDSPELEEFADDNF